MKYRTLQDLADAYSRGEVKYPLMLDNDSVSVWDDDETATEPLYEAHPEELLEDALALLGIPHEHV
jgi:hypothetical protein